VNQPIVDLRDPRFGSDKYGYIEELRGRGFCAPVANGFVFFNQDDAAHIMKCEDFAFSFFQIDADASPYLANAIRYELLNQHGAAHARLRNLVAPALRDRVMDGLRDDVETVVDALIDTLPDDGAVDLTADFAEPLPGRVLGPMFDIPYGETAGLNDWIRIGGRKVDALQSGDGLAEVEAANRNLHAYLRDLLRARRANPGSDMFSELIASEIDGDRLSEDELVYLAGELASAGVDTTRAQLPLILLALFRAPGEAARLKDNPRLALRAVDEGMRFAPLPWALPHRAVRDLTYKGIAFKEGDLAMVLVPAANRDPAVMDRPHLFDIGRDRVRNFSFGSGMHACPAAQLARMEMSIALAGLFSRTKHMTLLEEPDLEPVQKGSSPKSLKVHLTK